MHKRLVGNIILRILLFVCLVMTVPLAWGFGDEPQSPEVQAFVVTILVGLFIASLGLWIFRVRPEGFELLNAKDGLAIVGLSWICLSAFGALPLYLSGVMDSYTDAFFEITSGFTTTGATVIKDVETLPKGILFWRSLSQWLGGMGIIVLYLALLPAFGYTAFRLYKAEAPGITLERIEPRIRETAKSLWSVYFLLTLMETFLLMGGGMSFFEALCHSFSTLSTGGFSTRNASIGAFSAYTQWVVFIFMFLAGVNFILHYQALKGHPKAFFRDEEFRFYFFLTLGGILVFTLFLLEWGQSPHPLREAAFTVTSIITTTGFVTADFDTWPNSLRLGLILFMVLGGCGGSTSGGLKVIRFFLALKIALRSLIQTIFPNAIVPISYNAVPLNPKLILTVLSYFVIFIFLFLSGAALITITESCDLDTALTLSIASLSNVGPGLGEIGPTHTYAWVSIPGKWISIFLMLTGRLELYSILILFLPSTWRK